MKKVLLVSLLFFCSYTIEGAEAWPIGRVRGIMLVRNSTGRDITFVSGSFSMVIQPEQAFIFDVKVPARIQQDEVEFH